MTLFQWIERYFQRRQLRQLLEWLAHDEHAAGLFDVERLAVYRVPLPLEPVVALGYGPGTAITTRRGFWDVLGLGTRAYVVDGAPGALFGKPNMLAVFRGFGGPATRISERPLAIGDGWFDYYDAPFLASVRVHGRVPVAPRGGLPIAALSPIRGPFAPADLPNPAPTAPPPTFPPPPTAPPGSGTPARLFYGLCFQEPRPNRRALYFGPLKIRDAFLETDPLWNNTQALAATFAARGYSASTGLAGDHEPSKATDAETFEQMMSGFESHLNTVTSYCNSGDDQLVLFVAAHGYGGASNPTGDVAMHYKPEDAEQWITYRDFFQRLMAMPKVSGFPGKVYLLVYSCRSGRVFEGGVLPGGLASMHLFTASASSDVLAGQGGFPDWLGRALRDPQVLTWDDLLRHAKHTARADSYGPPRNGNALGCRVRVTLNSVAYQGDDIGSTWQYRLRVDGTSRSPKGTINQVPGTELQVASHTVAATTLDTQNLPLYDALWTACGPANTVNLSFFVHATQTDGIDDTGSKTAAVSFTCDGTTTQPVVTVLVSEAGGTASMVFSFTVATSCL